MDLLQSIIDMCVRICRCGMSCYKALKNLIYRPLLFIYILYLNIHMYTYCLLLIYKYLKIKKLKE